MHTASFSGTETVVSVLGEWAMGTHCTSLSKSYSDYTSRRLTALPLDALGREGLPGDGEEEIDNSPGRVGCASVVLEVGEGAIS
jgi:hypothetical protein